MCRFGYKRNVSVSEFVKLLPPSGAEQALSLVWALKNFADLSEQEGEQAVCGMFGIDVNQWRDLARDGSWFVGDLRGYNREKIEAKWNQRFAGLTGVWLNEDVWHTPLWQLWLKDQRMVLAANLSYLIKIEGHGTVGQLAEFTGRDRSTISKWGRWKEEGSKVRVPPATIMPRILEFFGLKPTCDLSREPLFLGLAEINDVVLRSAGRHYLNCLSGEHLNQAVERLREESARYAVKSSRDRQLRSSKN